MHEGLGVASGSGTGSVSKEHVMLLCRQRLQGAWKPEVAEDGKHLCFRVRHCQSHISTKPT